MSGTTETGPEFGDDPMTETAVEAYEETEDNWRSFLGPLYPTDTNAATLDGAQ